MDGSAPIGRLLAIMTRLRDPDGGCPWDLEQNFATIAPYTIEEAYEVAEAAQSGDMAALKEELGDLLLQVVFHSRMAEEQGAFAFGDVAEAICAKMIRRHPHVFGDAKVATAADQTRAWEAQKAAERAAKGKGARTSALDGVPLALPALTRALKLQSRAADVQFDWDSAAPILAKLAEEIGELTAEATRGASQERLTDEFGDILFVTVNVARHLKVDPEAALRSTNAKFERRFREVERRLAAQGTEPARATLAEMDALWDAIKREEKSASGG